MRCSVTLFGGKELRISFNTIRRNHVIRRTHLSPSVREATCLTAPPQQLCSTRQLLTLLFYPNGNRRIHQRPASSQAFIHLLRRNAQSAYYKEVMKPLSENRRAKFDYDILEYIEAGIELFGHEVKSVKGGHGNLAGAYAILRGGEAFLINCQIPPYQQGNVPDDYDPSRTRRLLLRKEEIRELTGRLKTKGLSLVALSFVTKKNLVKVELGLGTSRKAHDKREVLKKRAVQREIDRGE